MVDGPPRSSSSRSCTPQTQTPHSRLGFKNGARAQLDASTQLVRDAIAQIVEAGDAGEDGNEIPDESLLRIVQCEESTFTAAIFGRVLARLEDLNEAILRGGVVHLI